MAFLSFCRSLLTQTLRPLTKLKPWCQWPTLLVTAGVLVLMLWLKGAGQFLEQWRENAATARDVTVDLQEAAFLQKHNYWVKALQVLEKAKTRLSGSGLASLQDEVDNRLRVVALVIRLEKVQQQALSSRGANIQEADRAFGVIFAEHGMGVGAADVEKTAHQIRISPIRLELVTALDHWALVKDALSHDKGNSIRAIAYLADDDSWRKNLRDSAVAQDCEALLRLAEDKALWKQSPTYLPILRRQVLYKLKADLAASQALLDKEPNQAGPAVEQQMRRWQDNPNFECVRSEENLAFLREAERREWQTLWAKVEELEKRASAFQPR